MSEYPLSEETQKYDKCYSLENYHLQGQRLKRVTRDVLKMESGKTYLDVGCGRGEMVKLANERNVTAFGLELVPKLCDGNIIKQGSVLDIDYADKTFDYVSCYDMIEHLPPEFVDRALDELFRITASTLFITTNDKRSHLGDLELHLTRRPRPWWNEKLVERARVRGNWQMIEDTYGISNEEWHWEIRLDL